MPLRYGKWQSLYDRFNFGRRDGKLDRVLERLHLRLNEAGRLDHSLWNVDATSIRPSRSAAGAARGKNQPYDPADQALGRSRGGFGTKVHPVVDGHGIPLAATVSAGQAHESRQMAAVLESMRLPGRRGRPRQRPKKLAGDKGYSFPGVRAYLRSRGIGAVIPSRKDQRTNPRFDKVTYRRSNVVERCAGWLKENRQLATRHAKLAANYLATVKLAMSRRCFKLLEPSDRTHYAEALEEATKPVLITHAGCMVVHPHPRNKSDDELRRLAKNGGVVGIYDLPYLTASPHQPNLDEYFAHLDYALKICGEEHVGIGSDQATCPFDTSPEAMAEFNKAGDERYRKGVAAPDEDRPLYV